MWVQSLASLSGLRISVAMSCSVGCRQGSDLVLLWRRPKAAVLIRPLAWERPYATGVALKKVKKKKFNLIMLRVKKSHTNSSDKSNR